MKSIGNKIREFVHGVLLGTARFPAAVLFAVVLTVVSIVLDHDDHSALSDSAEFFLYWYPITAIFLSVALTLWYEERRTRGTLMVYVSAELIWLGIMALLSHRNCDMSCAPGNFILLGIMALLIMAVFAMPFLGRSDPDTDVMFWNFTSRIIPAAAVALVVAGILCGGICLLLLSLENLFGLDFSDRLYGDIALVCFLLIMPIITLQGIPGGQYKYDNCPIMLPELIVGAVRYLFVPLTMAYIVTLYVYAARILVTWELPHGWVSWPVSFSMFAVTALFVLTYPYVVRADVGSSNPSGSVAGARLSGLITRWLPLLMLPLLVLMSIGIVRRVSEYGISILRIYLIFFNIWCYVACAAMAFCRSHRIMWIPLSAVALFALLSVFPVNVSTVVRNKLTAQLDEILAGSSWNGQQMDNAAYSEWLRSLDRETAAKADSRLEYLKREFSQSQVEYVIASDVWPGHVSRTDSKAKVTDDGSISLSSYQLMSDITIPVPEAATAFIETDGRTDISGRNIINDTLHISLPVVTVTEPTENSQTEDGNITATFAIPMENLRSASDGMSAKVCPYNDASGHYTLIIRNFSLSLNGDKDSGSCFINGLIFIR